MILLAEKDKINNFVFYYIMCLGDFNKSNKQESLIGSLRLLWQITRNPGLAVIKVPTQLQGKHKHSSY